MNETTARRFVDHLEAAAHEREQLSDATEAADELGVRGILSRTSAAGIRAEQDGEHVFAVLWDETLMEAREDLDRVLGGHDVPYLLYKGGALLGDQYVPGDVRIVDLDVLVPLTAKDRASEALVAEGWSRKEPVGGPTLRGAPGAVFERPFAGDAVSALDVDVHWRVAPVERLMPWRGSALPDEVWRDAVRSVVGPVPRVGHHAALLVHHSVRHDFLHFRSVFDLIQLWPVLREAGESRAFDVLSKKLKVSRAARWLCRVIVADLGLDPLGPDFRGLPPGRPPAPLRSLRSLIGLALDATDREFEAMTLSRGLRRLATVDHGVRAAGPLMTDALFPPDEYLRWRWPGARGPMRRLQHLGRVLGRFSRADAEPTHSETR